MMFLSPVFYAVQSVPEAFGNWMWLNPLTYFIETFRYCLLGGIVPDAAMLWPPALIGLMTLIFGYVFFQRVRSGFADIL